MAAQASSNYKVAGILFLAASAMFFFTDNTALGVTFLALGGAFIGIAMQGGSGPDGKGDA